ncbi:MAG: FtsX-like permease family protein [Lachnospiraceae bacterium]|nr:FtsX-like permease family protein [Lachnospiraceae bacterium]
MYLNILRKDLKRKRTMNIIIFLFAVIGACFVGSGWSNVVTVLNGTGYFFEKANIGDLFIVDYGDGKETHKRLKDMEEVSQIREEHGLIGIVSDLQRVSGKKINDNSMLIIQPVTKDSITYFDQENEVIRQVKPGEIYLPAKLFDQHSFSIGDKVRLQNHDARTKELTIAGSVKDALLGTTMMGSTRVLINQEEFQKLQDESTEGNSLETIFCVRTTDPKAVNSRIAGINSISLNMTTETLKLAYIMYMILAMVVLAISICLILVSFVVLKYVITFSINEEFREIGVMKAIGIRNSRIRTLFAVKYACMAAIGSVIGFFISIPFGNMLIDSVSDSMVLGNEGGIRYNMAGALAVAILMTLLAYHSTAKVKKCSPLDAIRSGQTGERYGKKSKISLAKHKMSSPLFLAVNDLLSYPKRYITILISFFLCSVFTFGLVLMADTMRSDRLITSFGTKGDVYLDPEIISRRDRDYIIQAKSNSGDLAKQENPYDKAIREIEQVLLKHHMPGKVSAELFYVYKITVNGEERSQYCEQNPYISMTDYTYQEGSAPSKEDEIAITPKVAKSLSIGIGDSVTIAFPSGKKTCIVTAIIHTMNQLGDCILLHTKAPTSPQDVAVMMMYQINFKDHPTQAVIDKRIEKIKKIYHTKDVMNATDYVVDCMKSADAMDAVVKLLLAITILVVLLVAILMERSFISDEEGSIALLRAIGLKTSSIVKWHIYRFTFVALLAEILAVSLALPITHLWADPIWAMMGQTKIHYYFKPLSLLVLYPGLILVVTVLTVSLTALQIGRIQAKDIVTIE